MHHLARLALLLAALFSPATHADELYELLAAFDEVAEFIDPHDGADQMQDDLQRECQLEGVLRCLTYLYAHPASVQAALPDNPAYWDLFHQIMAAPAGLERPTEVAPDGAAFAAGSRLFEAANFWIWHAIASDRFDPAAFVDYFRNIRRLSAGSRFLIERMVFTAMLGISHQQVELLLAHYAHMNKLPELLVLSSELHPFSVEERSFRAVLAGEQSFVENLLQNPPARPDGWQHLPGRGPALPLDEHTEWALQNSAREWEVIVNYYAPLSEMSWDDYWGGTAVPGLAQPQEADFQFASPASLASYIGTGRSAEVHIYLLQALFDVYFGATSPGLPARQPPPFWQWSWHQDTQRICLVPTHVERVVLDFSVARPACVTYVD